MTDREAVGAVVRAIRRAMQPETEGAPGQLESFRVENIHTFASRLIRAGVIVKEEETG